MTRDEAVLLLHDLEPHRATNTDGDPDLAPTFDVRLDAGHNRHDERTYRVYVTAGPWGAEPSDWAFVLQLAQKREHTVTLEDAGIAIT